MSDRQYNSRMNTAVCGMAPLFIAPWEYAMFYVLCAMCYVLTGGVRGDRGTLGPSRCQGGCEVSQELRTEKRERRRTGSTESGKGDIHNTVCNLRARVIDGFTVIHYGVICM